MKKGEKEANTSQLNILKIIWQKPWLAIAFVLLTILQAGLIIANIIFDARALEALTLGDYENLLKYGILILITGLLLATRTILSNYLIARLRLHTMGILENKIGARMLTISSQVYNSLNSGTIVSRVNMSPAELFNGIKNILSTTSQLLVALFTIIYMMFFHYILALMVLFTVVVAYLFRVIINKYDKKNYRKMNDSYDKMYGRAIETARGYKDIKCLNLDETINKDLEGQIKEYTKQSRYFDNWYMVANTIFRIIYAILLAGLVYLGIVLYEQYYLSYFALIYLLNNYKQLDLIVWVLQQIFRIGSYSMVQHKRINQLFRDDMMPREVFGQTHLDKFSGEIEFKNIDFVYEKVDLEKKLTDDIDKGKKQKKKKQKDKDENTNIDETPPHKVLDNFSLKINAGEKVAFVGRSGCGKSTLVSMLSKSTIPQSGEIYFDNVPMSELDKESIRGNVTVVNQFPYVYYLSVRDNLKLAKADATDEELMNACEKANLDKFIAELPYGLDTVLGENGVKLSGGQKQRLAIARAFLRNTQVLVFDESTSSLDNFSQKKVQESIDGIKGKTVIIVAHRLSTIINCDRIVFIKNGKVEAQGKFKELMKNCPDFAELYTVRR